MEKTEKKKPNLTLKRKGIVLFWKKSGSVYLGRQKFSQEVAENKNEQKSGKNDEKSVFMPRYMKCTDTPPMIFYFYKSEKRI